MIAYINIKSETCKRENTMLCQIVYLKSQLFIVLNLSESVQTK